MEVKFDTKNWEKEISEKLSKIPYGFETEEKILLRKIGNILKKHVVQQLSKYVSDRSKWTFQNKKYHIPHMKDDVQSKIKKNKYGNLYVSVGGKKTGWKWHFLNDGTSTTIATHFADIAEEQSKSEIETEIDNLIRKVVE